MAVTAVYSIEDETVVSTVIENAKALYRQVLHQASLDSIGRYQQMLQLQYQDYVLAPRLSAVKTLEAVDLSADSDVVAMVLM